MLFKILRRINSNFLRNGKNSFAGLEIQSVDFITSQKFRNFPADASSLALLPKLNTRSYFLAIEGDRIQWKIRKDEQLANSNYINSGDKAGTRRRLRETAFDVRADRTMALIPRTDYISDICQRHTADENRRRRHTKP